ncbi:outer membrane beta-barrel protein [Desulfococcus sp.]|uniref:outer membrane beta-barrel protein n=1 Tax=Desulfococcus sp. TaxID=2025834 RepID=UPI003D1393D9
MKKCRHISLSLICAFFICALSTVTSIAGDATLLDFQNALGIQTDTAFLGMPLSDIREGDVIDAVVVDASKMGGCKPGDRVKLFFMGEDKWMVKHLDSGNAVDIVTVHQNGTLKLAKTGTYTPATSETAPAPTTSNMDDSRHLTAVFKAGGYFPNNDLDDFDTGFNAELALNRYLSPYFALEASIGYANTDDAANGNFYAVVNNDVYTIPARADADIHIIPVTASAKGVLPFNQGEVYLGGGLGVYYVYGDFDIQVAGFEVTADDHDAVLGAHIVAGLNINIDKRVFLGIEGKRIFTDEAELSDTIEDIPIEAEFDLNGYTLTGQIGYRF